MRFASAIHDRDYGMGIYHGRDLVRAPGLLSLSRIPLAFVFPFVVGRPWLAFAVLLGAGLTDVLDGWYARRFHQVTATGSVIDPITDKIFVMTVAVTLVVLSEVGATALVGVGAAFTYWRRELRAARRDLLRVRS
jgi:phosphatidylglycerophosphate synthase